jgi:hypothetical protein
MFDRRVYGPENLCSATQKDFCNKIGTKRTSQADCGMSAVEGITDIDIP